MLLPKHTCENIDYYTTTVIEKGNCLFDKTTIFFKQWWKPRKNIIIRRVHRDKLFYANNEHEELKQQLHQLAHDTWIDAKITKKEGNVINVEFKQD